MTAKESFESLLFNYEPDNNGEFKAHLLRFAAQLCKEQLEIAAMNVDNEAMSYGIQSVQRRIINAPQPEL